MTQESWKYLINGSYVMLASLFIPIGYSSLSVGGYYIRHLFIWIFGLFIYVDGMIGTRWFFEIKIITDYWYSWFYWLLPLISILIILFCSIIIMISARKIKQGKRIKKWIISILILLQTTIILVNLAAYFGLMFFGYLGFIFALILLIIGNKELPKK